MEPGPHPPQNLSILNPPPRTGDELPVGRPGDTGLGAAHSSTHQLQPLAPAQGDISGQEGEGGHGVDGEGEPADGPPSRVHCGAGIAPGVPFLHRESGEDGGGLRSGVQQQPWLAGLHLYWLFHTQKAMAWPQSLFPAHISKLTLP